MLAISYSLNEERKCRDIVAYAKYLIVYMAENTNKNIQNGTETIFTATKKSHSNTNNKYDTKETPKSAFQF